nr:hypothetical protein [Tanacetum cinerariifolium]
MIDCLSIVEMDKVNHTVEIDIVNLVVEIKSFGMSANELDKETTSSNGLEPKQADLSCVHALNEHRLHEIHVVLKNVIAVGAEIQPSMLEKGMYDSWKTRIWLYIKGKENGKMLINSIEEGPFQLKKEFTVLGVVGALDKKREQTVEDLSPKEKTRYDCDIKAVNIHLLGLPINIYTLINHNQTTKEIWDRVKKLMESMELTLQENVIAVGAEIQPSMLEKGMYDSWKTRIWLYIKGKENGKMLINSIEEGPFQLKKEFTVLGVVGALDKKREQTVEDLSPKEKTRYDCDIKAVNIHLLGLPINIYTLINHNQTTKEIWDRVKKLMESMELTLQEYQQDLLADRLEEMEDCNDLQLQTTSNFKADYVDAYDSDCDDKATASAIFMASISPAGSLNHDTVAPTYDLDMLSEVPHYDTYHENDVLNSVVQEMEYTEHFVSNNDSYDKLTSDSNVISYVDDMVSIENDVTQYVPPSVKENSMILSIIE